MATMADVARVSAVSPSTVSHVLNRTRHVDPATRRRVEQAVADLGYRRNTAARTLAGGSSNTLGLSISGLTNPYFGPLLQAIERRVSGAGYVLVLGDSHDETGMERRVIESLLERRVDGLIAAPSASFQEAAGDLFASSEVPLVLIDRSLDMNCDQVTPENIRSAEMLTEHLIEHGHRRIAAITGSVGLNSSTERESGYRAALARHGIPVDETLVVSGDSRVDTAEVAVEKLLQFDSRPTAIVTLNNAMTIGTLRAIQSARLTIPGDIALACYDDFEWSDLFHPGLTAIAQNVAKMGANAVDTLLDRISGSDRSFEHQVIDTEFHRRTSCGCSPEG
ncbi:LacI family transcriptional regulator [Leucobacter sp. Psy1]|uniref:LacI family DNA-binding transcriptional regulator n=1 Tax=Leucobacter sp. Psy1 TaxID=2875729 RepID=UPI001CD6BED1|nr:LacI family DNA-binding transcriptional regulator [Leucobacter sp. Psy1]UBH06822.1 LacI family transcriptional regulator [Leucobacter sp. Psy1]